MAGFNPRTPCGVRPKPTVYSALTPPFQSTHSLRSATPASARKKPKPEVSIHALLAECDDVQGLYLHRGQHVSIHALLAECDICLLTLPKVQGCFNPRTPCGVRPSTSSVMTPSFPVSIHALLAECDNSSSIGAMPREVSIHALLAECDPVSRLQARLPDSFNPRTPCGVRRSVFVSTNPAVEFQSTHSLRSATSRMRYRASKSGVSIHALLAECDDFVRGG